MQKRIIISPVRPGQRGIRQIFRNTQEDVMKGKKIVPLLLAAVMGVSVLAGCGNSIDGKKAGATLDGE